MPDLRVVHEVRHERAEEVRLREEVGVEYRDELALGDLQPRVERARLVARAVDAVDVRDVERRVSLVSASAAVRRSTDERARLVGRVVEHLDLQLSRG